MDEQRAKNSQQILKNVVGGDLSYQTLRFIMRLNELRQSTVAWAQTEANGVGERARHRPMQSTNMRGVPDGALKVEKGWIIQEMVLNNKACGLYLRPDININSW